MVVFMFMFTFLFAFTYLYLHVHLNLDLGLYSHFVFAFLLRLHSSRGVSVYMRVCIEALETQPAGAQASPPNPSGSRRVRRCVRAAQSQARDAS